MIPKLELQNIINKYYLNGLIESTKWDIKDRQLNIKFTAPTREMIGEINHLNFDLEKSSIGINNTSQLLKLINITNGDLLLTLIKTQKLIIADNQYTVNYTLADLQTIPKTGAYNGSEEYDLEIEIDKEIIAALIKAKSALDDSNTVLIKPFISLDGNSLQLELIFGGDIEYSNKVSYFLTNIFQNKNTPQDFSIGFNSDILKEILVANKESDKAKIFINLEGLIKFEFESPNLKTKYYLVKKDV